MQQTSHRARTRQTWQNRQVQRPSNRSSKHAPQRSHTARIVGWSIAGVIVVLAFVVMICGMIMLRQAQTVKNHEEQVVTSLAGLSSIEQLKDPQALNTAIQQASTHAQQAQKITNSALWRVASGVPFAGDDVRVVRGLADVMVDLTSTTLPKLSTTASTLLSANLSAGDSKLNMQPILDQQQSIDTLAQQFDQYNQRIQSLPTPHTSQVRNAYEQASTQFSTINERVQQVNAMMQGMPALLGAQGSRNYLLVAGTPSEERSGLGLVGSMGLMTVDHGSINVGNFHSNREFIHYPSAATSEEKQIFAGPLHFSMDIRDTFAIPDMSRVAEMVNYVWQESPYKSQVDGVIAIDPVFIQKMVKLQGNITLPDGRQLDGSNTAQFMMHDIYNNYGAAEQDLYFEFLASSVMKHAFSNMNSSSLLKVATSIGELAQNRHFYAYTFHKDEAQYLQGAGLSKDVQESETKPTVGVFLNENNPGKLGWYLDRSAVITKKSGKGTAGATYHVKFTIHNRITQQQVATDDPYIVGLESRGIAPNGTSVQRMLFYAPKGGSITNFTSTGDVRGQTEVTLDGKTLLRNDSYIGAGKTVTYEFDVTVSDRAQEKLSLDTSPAGVLAVPVTYNAD